MVQFIYTLQSSCVCLQHLGEQVDLGELELKSALLCKMVVSRQAGRTLGVRGSSFTYRRLLTAGGGILLLMFAMYTWITSPFGPGGKMVRGYLEECGDACGS